jgi:putative oxidoreductase
MLGRWLKPYQHYGNLILRSLVGVVFLAHGSQKLFGAFGGPGLEGTGKMFEQIGLASGQTWATVVGTIEFFGGMALIIGFLTRYAALLLSAVMVVAIFAVHLPNGFFMPTGVEFAFALLAATLTLLVGGPGPLAVDHWFARRWELNRRWKSEPVTPRRAA